MLGSSSEVEGLSRPRERSIAGVLRIETMCRHSVSKGKHLSRVVFRLDEALDGHVVAAESCRHEAFRSEIGVCLVDDQLHFPGDHKIIHIST